MSQGLLSEILSAKTLAYERQVSVAVISVQEVSWEKLT